MPPVVRRLWQLISGHKYLVLSLLFLLAILLVNSLHEEYPDEFDSIVGGRYILEGKLPYRDWFQHHQPGAYLLAALLLPISDGSFVRFRIVLSVAFFIIYFLGYQAVKRRGGESVARWYLPFLLLLGAAGTYFWGQMLLADTLAAYLFIPAYAIILTKEVNHQKYQLADVAIISLFSFLTWFTSMTYTYLVVGTLIYVLIRLTAGARGEIRETLTSALMIIAVPYLLFFLFFAVTGSLDDYLFANITY